MGTPLLYLHVGVHKTGTTTIQHALRASQLRLAKEGIAYLRLPRSLGRLWAPVDPRTVLTPADLKRFRRAVHYERASKVVISRESMSGSLRDGYRDVEDRAHRLRQITDGFDARVVVYLRRQDTFIESAYVELIQQGESFSFDEYVASLPVDAFSWKRLVEAYAEQFGRDAILIRTYDESRLEEAGGLIADFAGVIGSRTLPEAELCWKNQGLTRDALEIARDCNRHLDSTGRRRLRDALQAASAKDPFAPHGYFSTWEDRRRFLDRYTASNRVVAQDWMEPPAGQLFPGPEPESEPQPYPGLTSEHAARVLALAVMHLDDGHYRRGLGEKSVKGLAVLRYVPGIGRLLRHWWRRRVLRGLSHTMMMR